MSNYVKQMRQAEAVTGFGPKYGPSFAPHANASLVRVQDVATRPIAPLSGLADTITNPWFIAIAGVAGYWLYKNVGGGASSRRSRRARMSSWDESNTRARKSLADHPDLLAKWDREHDERRRSVKKRGY